MGGAALLLSFALSRASAAGCGDALASPASAYVLNTSNSAKRAEYADLFERRGLSVTFGDIDLREVEADAITVVVHKASQFDSDPPTIIEDTSLDVEGARVGVNVRWLLDHLPQFEGRRATWTVLLGFRAKDRVTLYRGEVRGSIVPARGTGFGFDPVFRPDGEVRTLAEAKPDRVNARAMVVRDLVAHSTFGVYPVIPKWTGPWQEEHR